MSCAAPRPQTNSPSEPTKTKAVQSARKREGAARGRDARAHFRGLRGVRAHVPSPSSPRRSCPRPTGRRNRGRETRGLASRGRCTLALKWIAAPYRRASPELADGPIGSIDPVRRLAAAADVLVSLALQAPGIALTWPPRPNAIELAAGGALIALGLAFNLWADATFKRAGVEVVPFGATPR